MAEANASMAQRVEALEQISYARVVERVGAIEQRVSRIESAREADEQRVATKADIARLQTQLAETRETLTAQNNETREILTAQYIETRETLTAQDNETRTIMTAQDNETREMIMAVSAEAQRERSAIKTELKAKISNIIVEQEKHFRQFLMWLIGIGLTLAGVVIAATVAIVSQLS